MVDENNHSCFKRSSTVKYLRACSAVRLSVLDYSPILLGDTEKNLEKPLPPPPRTLRPFGPPLLSEFLLPSVGGGGGGLWIFSGNTQLNPLYTDTPLIRTLSMAHSVSILTRFDRTVHKLFLLKTNQLLYP